MVGLLSAAVSGAGPVAAGSEGAAACGADSVLAEAWSGSQGAAVAKAAASGGVSHPSPAAAGVPRGETTRVKMSPLRRTIARRLVQAQQEAAMLTTFNEVDMSAVMALRKRHQEAFVAEHGIKLGFMSFFVKAVLEGLKAAGIEAGCDEVQARLEEARKAQPPAGASDEVDKLSGALASIKKAGLAEDDPAVAAIQFRLDVARRRRDESRPAWTQQKVVEGKLVKKRAQFESRNS